MCKMGQSYNSGKVTSTITGSVSSGISQPTSTQTVHYAVCNVGSTATTTQLDTVTGSKNIYYLGFSYIPTSTTRTQLNIFDASSGSASPPGSNAWVTDTGVIAWQFGACVVGQPITQFLPAPLKLTTGLRVTVGDTGASGSLIVYYMTEAV